jgi:hypothetical protein
MIFADGDFFVVVGVIWGSLAILRILLSAKKHKAAGVDATRTVASLKPSKAPESAKCGQFPDAFSQCVAIDDMQEWMDIVARMYEVEFHPTEPPSSKVEHHPETASLLHDLRAQERHSKRCLHEPIDDIWFARALIACDFDAQKSSQLVQDYIAWREQSGGLVIPSEAWLNYAIVIVPFEDSRGRPVAISRLRSYHKGLPIEMMTNGYRATADGVIAHMLMNRASQFSRTNPMEQWVLCIDCIDVGWDNVSMEYIKMFISESKERYMERISVIYMLHPPSAWRLMWAMVKPLLHPRTLRKIKLVPSHEVPIAMRNLMGDRADACLPPNYGGSAAPFPAPGHGSTLDEKVGALLADSWRKLGIQLPSDDVPSKEPTPSGSKRNGCCMGYQPERNSRGSSCCGWLSCFS